MNELQSENSIKELLEINRKILNELKAQNIHAQELWSVKEIAAHLLFSESYTRRYVITHPSFPAPITLPTGELRGSRRWPAKQVRAWALNFQK
jgi:hypothetical protein